MHLNRLKALIGVIDAGSFSQAARLLGMSQPAVSHQIKALESSLGATLIDRHTEPVQATTAGRIAYQQAKSILAMWNETEHQVSQCTEAAVGRLCIGASTVPATYMLPRLIVRFKEANPQVDVAMDVSDSDVVRDWVLNERVDVGAVGSLRDDRGLVQLPLGEDELRLIGPCWHPLAQGGPVSPQDLLSETLISREQGSGTRQAMEEAFLTWGINPAFLKIPVELGSTEAVVAAVEAGLGVSFVSHWAVRPALALQRVCTLQVDAPPIQRRFYLIYRRKRNQDPLIQRFVHLIEGAGVAAADLSTGNPSTRDQDAADPSTEDPSA